MGVVPFMLLTLAKQYRNIQSLFNKLRFMPLFYETVLSGAMGLDKGNILNVIALSLLYYYIV